jgi:O-antigen ligase
MRVNESVAIRWDLLSKAAFPSMDDPTYWLFGRGFGWSRWQIDSETVMPIFVGSGTHIFFIDVLLDVGLVGLLLLIFSVIRLYFIVPKKPLSDNSEATLMSVFICFFCVTLSIKMFFASDTYSEPLLILFFGVLISRAVHFLASEKLCPEPSKWRGSPRECLE